MTSAVMVVRLSAMIALATGSAAAKPAAVVTDPCGGFGCVDGCTPAVALALCQAPCNYYCAAWPPPLCLESGGIYMDCGT